MTHSIYEVVFERALRASEVGPGVNLFGTNGKTRAGLIAMNDGASLALFDENAKPRAALSIGTDGTKLELSDENGKDRAVIGATQTVTSDGKATTYPESSILLFGSDGKVRWIAP